MEGDAEQPWDRPREDAGRPEGRSRRPGGSRPEDILTPKQYVNYQNGRILSGLLVFFGCMFAAVGAVQAVAAISNPAADPPVVVWAVFAALGWAGVVGGGAAFQGNRVWARLAYLFALPLLFGCPFGTIISLLWMNGLSRHLAACDRIRQARSE